MLSIFDRKVLERIGINLMPEESAITLLGMVFEHGKEFFLEGIQKEDFPRETGKQELRKLLLCISEESLLSDPYFSLSLYLGSLSSIDRTEKILGRELRGEEGSAAIKIALDDIFPSALSEKLFQCLLKNYQLFSKLTNEEFKEKLREYYERQKKTFPKPGLENKSKCMSVGTDTWLVPCPNCSLEKRCDARTKRFRCKCGLEKPYDGKNRRFLE